MLPSPVPQRARPAPHPAEPTGLVPALVLLGFGLTALCGVAALLLLGRLPAPAVTPGLPVVAPAGPPTSTPEPAIIEGALWDDLCNGNTPSTPACVLDGSGRYSGNGVWDASETGLPGVLVTLGLGACPAAPVLSALTGPGGGYRFGGLPPGTYCIAVDPAHGENVSLVPGGWTWPVPGAGVAAQVTVNLGAGQVAVANFGWDRHDELYTPTPPASATAGLPATASATPGCSDHAAFMADVTIPDQASLPATTPFTKTWRVLNTGSCTWDTTYALAFSSGEPLGGPPSLPLPATVPPGSVVDLSIGMAAPPTLGPHEGAWLLRGRDGQTFGTGPAGNVPLRVRIVVIAALPTATPAPDAWQAAYFPNRDLSGQPVLTRGEAGLNNEWGLGAPAPGVPTDDFSARWTGSPTFEEDGTYRFTVTVDDGARLYVDGELILDDWRDASRHDTAVERPLLAGAHPVRLEYYDRSYEAVAILRWERVGPYPFWRGEYWDNPTLSGSPRLVREDRQLDFAWGDGSPDPSLPADNFSARWTRAVPFDAGTYRFRVTVDDGVRLWVDDQLVIDAWVNGPPREITGDVGVAAGTHTVRVEYLEMGVEARLAVRWERLGN